ncbi:ATP-binding protein [Thermodesulfovibrio sp.]|uniref:ATP-binding protein n=1 Tax=Thermodesulfovibrio sp. TaxID=2067987 RepID=UPI0030968BA1
MLNIKSLIEKLELIHQRLKLAIPKNLRPYYENLDIDHSRGLIVYGQRGVGKTTFLLYRTLNKPFLYVSVDHPLVTDINIYELTEAVFKAGYQGIVLDEVQYAKDWAVQLKALYDSFPDLYIWASGSSSLMLKSGSADFSRRFIFKRIPLLSFREYLYLKHSISLEPVDLFEQEFDCLSKVQSRELLRAFREHLNSGTRPFFFEGDYCERLKLVLDKALFHDIPLFLQTIGERHLKLMRAVLGHLLYSSVPTLNISSLCRDWQISKEKLYELLLVMEQTEILKLIKRKTKENGFKRGSKILLTDPAYYYCFDGDVGTAREAFAVYNLSERYGEIFACYDERECDYIVKGIKIEIGGKNKKIKNSDIVLTDEIDLPVRNKIPLYFAGLVY